MVSLGAISFDELVVADEVTGFGELALSGSAILSGNLMVRGMILSVVYNGLIWDNFIRSHSKKNVHFHNTLFSYLFLLKMAFTGMRI